MQDHSDGQIDEEAGIEETGTVSRPSHFDGLFHFIYSRFFSVCSIIYVDA